MIVGSNLSIVLQGHSTAPIQSVVMSSDACGWFWNDD